MPTQNVQTAREWEQLLPENAQTTSSPAQPRAMLPPPPGMAPSLPGPPRDLVKQKHKHLALIFQWIFIDLCFQNGFKMKPKSLKIHSRSHPETNPPKNNKHI